MEHFVFRIATNDPWIDARYYALDLSILHRSPAVNIFVHNLRPELFPKLSRWWLVHLERIPLERDAHLLVQLDRGLDYVESKMGLVSEKGVPRR